MTELVAALVRALQPELVVETGTCWGWTAAAIGEALLLNGHGRLVTLEVDADKCAAAAERCEGLPVEVRCQPSLTWEPDETIGFAWFDSLPQLRVEEFRRYVPWMRGQICAFHDTSPNYGTLAADIAALPVTAINLPTPRGVTICEARWH